MTEKTTKSEVQQPRQFLFPVEGIEGKHEALVRVMGTAEMPLFCAQDVCEVLSLANPSKATDGLDEDELVSLKVISGGQSREMLHVTESGLYHLIFKSRKAAAKRFRRWVTEEVLPALRQKGAYVLGGEISREETEMLTMPEWLAELQVDMREEVNLAGLLLSRVERAARELRYTAASYRAEDGYQRMPRSVLSYAVGLFKRDARSPANKTFFETVPRLAGE